LVLSLLSSIKNKTINYFFILTPINQEQNIRD